MIVTATAANRQAEPNGASRLDAVHDILDARLFRDPAPFAVERMIAMKSGRDFLVERRVRQQVARKLLDGELIERHVRVDRANRPISPRPHRARAVSLIPVRVGVPRGIEPIEHHPFAITRRREQPIHEPLKSIGRRIGEERVHFFQRRWHARQIKRHAPDERRLLSLIRERKSFLREPFCDEGINGTEVDGTEIATRDILGASLPLLLPPLGGEGWGGGPMVEQTHIRNHRPARREEAPVRLPLRPLIDPLLQQFNLRGRQRAV